MSEKNPLRTKLTGVRVSFPNFAKPQAPEDSNSEPKYNATFLIPARSKLHRALLNAIDALKKDERALKTWGGKVPPKNKLATNIKTEDDNVNDDGDVLEGYEGMVTINAKATTKRPMALVDRHVSPVAREDADEVFYGGCYVNVVVEVFAYKNSGNVGVGWGLLAVQFAKDGEPFGGASRVDVDEEFSDLGDDEDFDDEDFDDEDNKRKKNSKNKSTKDSDDEDW